MGFPAAYCFSFNIQGNLGLGDINKYRIPNHTVILMYNFIMLQNLRYKNLRVICDIDRLSFGVQFDWEIYSVLIKWGKIWLSSEVMTQSSETQLFLEYFEPFLLNVAPLLSLTFLFLSQI